MSNIEYYISIRQIIQILIIEESHAYRKKGRGFHM